MAKKLVSARAIQDEINRRIAGSAALDGSCRDCRVLPPRKAETEDFGSNWHVDYVEHFSAGCFDVIDRIVRAVRREYDCGDW